MKTRLFCPFFLFLFGEVWGCVGVGEGSEFCNNHTENYFDRFLHVFYLVMLCISIGCATCIDIVVYWRHAPYICTFPVKKKHLVSWVWRKWVVVTMWLPAGVLYLACERETGCPFLDPPLRSQQQPHNAFWRDERLNPRCVDAPNPCCQFNVWYVLFFLNSTFGIVNKDVLLTQTTDDMAGWTRVSLANVSPSHSGFSIFKEWVNYLINITNSEFLQAHSDRRPCIVFWGWVTRFTRNRRGTHQGVGWTLLG